MAWDYPYFKESEMRCRCECGCLPKAEFMEKLVAMRIEAGFPFIINSGCRCAEHNQEVGGVGGSSHVLRLAADVSLYGERAFKFIGLAIKHGMTGLGIAQKGDRKNRYIHVDCVSPDDKYPRPFIWTY